MQVVSNQQVMSVWLLVGRSMSMSRRHPLVCSVRIADDICILLGQECHSDSDFLLILFYDRLQNRNEILFLLGILLIGDVPAELAQ